MIQHLILLKNVATWLIGDLFQNIKKQVRNLSLKILKKSNWSKNLNQ